MTYGFDFSEEKNLILIESRGIGFRDIIEAVKKGNKLDDLGHSNKRKYPNQRLMIVNIDGYAYVVPYVLDNKRKKTFLKTIYPSKRFTKKYL